MFEKIKLKRKISKLNKEIINNNSDDARYELAMIYLDGTILKKDESAAIQLLNDASAHGHLKSKVYLSSNKLSKIVNAGIDAVKSFIEEVKN